MGQPSRPTPSVRYSLVTLGLWLSAAVCSSLYLLAVGWKRLVAGSLLECTLICGMLLLVVNARPVQRVLAAVSPGHRRLLIALAFLSLWSQEVKVRALTFPFVDWRMYSDAVRSPRFRFLQYDGLTAAGQRTPVTPGEMVPSLDEWRLYGTLERLRGDPAAERQASQPRAADEALFERTLRAAATAHNRRHPGAPLVAVEVFDVTIDSASFKSDQPLSRQLWKRVPIAGPER
jgi:hypothetical protein